MQQNSYYQNNLEALRNLIKKEPWFIDVIFDNNRFIVTSTCARKPSGFMKGFRGYKVIWKRRKKKKAI